MVESNWQCGSPPKDDDRKWWGARVPELQRTCSSRELRPRMTAIGDGRQAYQTYSGCARQGKRGRKEKATQTEAENPYVMSRRRRIKDSQKKAQSQTQKRKPESYRMNVGGEQTQRSMSESWGCPSGMALKQQAEDKTEGRPKGAWGQGRGITCPA